MKRALVLVYGLTAYLAFLSVFVAGVDFLSNAGVVRGIDAGVTSSLPAALAIDLALIALFGVSHSVMARPVFKEAWTRLIPSQLERSTYVLVASGLLALTFWQWRAMPARVWRVDAAAARLGLWALFAVGLVIALVGTFLTNHFEFSGVRQVWLYARRRSYEPIPFQERGLYRYVRHPMMVGLLIWFWATPSMSVGHAGIGPRPRRSIP